MGHSSCASGEKSWLFSDCGCGCKGKKQEKKFLISLMSALVFFVIANPDTFRLTRSIFGKWVSSPTGCPSGKGLMLHTVVFLLVVWGMMNVKKEAFEIEDSVPQQEKVENPGPALQSDEVEVEEEVEEEVAGPSAPPAMVDMPDALPGMVEEQYATFDTKMELGSMDLTEEKDLSASAEYVNEGDSSEDAVTCECSNGKKMVMTA